MHTLTSVLLAGALLAAPALAKTPSDGADVLHEKCRLAIERETPFTTNVNWYVSGNRDQITATRASFEEMNQVRAHGPLQPLAFLTEEEFVEEIFGQEAGTVQIVKAILNDFDFRIAQGNDQFFIQVAFDGMTCGAWEVTKKSSS